MDYLTEERRLLQQPARDFAMNEVLPIANKLDPERGEIPVSTRNKLAELGYLGIMIPEAYGGQPTSRSYRARPHCRAESSCCSSVNRPKR